MSEGVQRALSDVFFIFKVIFIIINIVQYELFRTFARDLEWYTFKSIYIFIKAVHLNNKFNK